MKRTIKQCRGLENEDSCFYCKRQNDNADLLVRDLATDPDSGKRTCIHFI